MNSLATVRQRQTPWARRALGVFVVVWLNLVLQPCAMAFGGDHDGDCPNCPPAHSKQHDGHEMASMDMAEHGMSCAVGSADCGILDDYNYDGRTVQLKVKDAPNDLPVALVSAVELAPVARPLRYLDSHPIRSHPPGPPAPLNKLYCVYLK